MLHRFVKRNNQPAKIGVVIMDFVWVVYATAYKDTLEKIVLKISVKLKK